MEAEVCVAVEQLGRECWVLVLAVKDEPCVELPQLSWFGAEAEEGGECAE